MRDCGYRRRGILHDLSKFSPTEFIESVKYYQGNRSPIEACKEDKGYSLAWFHHRGINKHHSQYWCDISFGEVIPAKMPMKYLIEFICDGVGAGKAYLKDDWTQKSPLEYWERKDKKSFYHDETREEIRIFYEAIAILGWEEVAKVIKSQKKNQEFIFPILKTLISENNKESNPKPTTRKSTAK